MYFSPLATLKTVFFFTAAFLYLYKMYILNFFILLEKGLKTKGRTQGSPLLYGLLYEQIFMIEL
jgi:hypothetical protein